MMKEYRPTNTCFDDCMEYLNQLAEDPGRLHDLSDVLLCHGICVSEHLRESVDLTYFGPYSHAWINIISSSEVIDFALDTSTGEKIGVIFPIDTFLRYRGVREYVAYRPREMIECFKIHGRDNGCGPWRANLRQLCSDIKHRVKLDPRLAQIGTLIRPRYYRRIETCQTSRASGPSPRRRPPG